MPDLGDTLEEAPCGFLRVADDGTILRANRTLLEALGEERGALEGRHVGSILSAGGRIFYQTHVFPLLRLHAKVEEVYLSLRSAGNPDLPVLLNAVRRETEAGGVSDWVIVPMRQRNQFEDELLQAKKAAEEASQAKARFLSMMSHDLRAPLSGISMAAEVLASGASGPVTDHQRHDLRSIQEASQYVLRLVSDLLDYARLSGGHGDVRVEEVPLGEVFLRAESLVRRLVERAGLTFHLGACPPRTHVLCNPDRLQQIVLNLVTNSVKFTEDGGEVALTCEQAGSRVLIHVRDTGQGVAEDRLEKIFDPFAQGSEGEQEHLTRGGVGLGLAIGRELARAMGGDLTVESALGMGSVFTVSLPIAAPPLAGEAGGGTARQEVQGPLSAV